MYMKHDKFSEVELDIINRGKDGDLRSLEEMNFYFHYLNIFKKEYLDELYDKYRKKNFFWEYIGGVCLVCLPCGVLGIISLMCVNFPLAAFFFSLVAAGIIVPDLINSSQAKREYKCEIAELARLIKNEEKRISEEYEKEERKRLEEEKKNSMKDGFIINITDDIRTVLSSKYEGYEKEISALKSLGYKYLKLKELMKSTSSSEVLTMYPQFNTIIWSIEAKITENVKFKERHDLDLSELQSVLNEFNVEGTELMSLEELMEYVPKNSPKLELRAFPNF